MLPVSNYSTLPEELPADILRQCFCDVLELSPKVMEPEQDLRYLQYFLLKINHLLEAEGLEEREGGRVYCIANKVLNISLTCKAFNKICEEPLGNFKKIYYEFHIAILDVIEENLDETWGTALFRKCDGQMLQKVIEKGFGGQENFYRYPSSDKGEEGFETIEPQGFLDKRNSVAVGLYADGHPFFSLLCYRKNKEDSRVTKLYTQTFFHCKGAKWRRCDIKWRYSPELSSLKQEKKTLTCIAEDKDGFDRWRTVEFLCSPKFCPLEHSENRVTNFDWEDVITLLQGQNLHYRLFPQPMDVLKAKYWLLLAENAKGWPDRERLHSQKL